MPSGRTTTKKWAFLIAKGRELYESIQVAISNFPSTPLYPYFADKDGYEISVEPNQMPGIDPTIQGIFHEAGCPINEYVSVCCTNQGSQVPIYYNFIHGTGRVILCILNYGIKDMFWEDRNRQWFWSDMLSTCCTRVVRQMDKLEAIWR